MSSPLEKLLGPTLVGAGGSEVDTASLKGKVVGIYFSAHWCGPCRSFTPQLIKFYNSHAESKNFEIVFASSDRDEGAFSEYFGSMPWKALPFNGRKKEELSGKFKVRGIPTLVWVGEDGETITTDGRGAVMSHPDAGGFPWRPESVAEVLTDSVEVIAADGSKTSMADLRAKNDYIGLYFSAHWCGPCKRFTPNLSRWYKKESEGKKFDIIFVSSDEGPSEFDGYRADMPWKALPFELRDAKEDLSKACNVEGIPTLTFFDAKTLKVTTADARNRVEAQPDDFPWAPKPVEPLTIQLANINDGKVMIVFTDKMTDGDNEDAALAAVAPTAQSYFDKRASGKEDEEDILFAVADEDDDATPRVRSFLGLDKDEEGDDAVRIIVADIPNGVKYVYEGAGIPSADDIAVFVANIFGGGARPKGIRD